MKSLFGDEITDADYPVKLPACRPCAASGPDGETCKTCRYCDLHKHHDKRYYKCHLVEWTHGSGTDIRLKYKACGKWEGK